MSARYCAANSMTPDDKSSLSEWERACAESLARSRERRNHHPSPAWLASLCVLAVLITTLILVIPR